MHRAFFIIVVFLGLLPATAAAQAPTFVTIADRVQIGINIGGGIASVRVAGGFNAPGYGVRFAAVYLIGAK